MAQAIPRTTFQWNVTGQQGTKTLVYTEQPVPELGDSQVLVKIQGASLNYRDIMVANGTYPFGSRLNTVPGSDGAGIVLAIGKHVTRFKPGDKVVTIINPGHIGGSFTLNALNSALGGPNDGTFRQIGAFNEEGLVAMPEGLSFVEAATLSCAGLTAWNALFGLPGRQLAAGQWILTQGTGGVSTFAVKFAKAIGARVIATTSSAEKARLLTQIGADHVINYSENPRWGETAKTLTGDRGVDLVLEVGGPSTMTESVKSLKLDGTLSVVGSVGGAGKEVPSLLDCWMKLFTTRGVWVGSRLQMEDMCHAIEANLDKLRPVIDSRVFKLEQLKEAYEYLEAGKHQGKVCIEID